MTLTCGQCRHAHKSNGPAGEVLFCRRYPPTFTPVVMPGQQPTPSNPHGIGVQLIPVRPMVQPDDTCGEYAPNLASVSPLRGH